MKRGRRLEDNDGPMFGRMSGQKRRSVLDYQTENHGLIVKD